jgi:plastocyanin domain-containing protein
MFKVIKIKTIIISACIIVVIAATAICLSIANSGNNTAFTEAKIKSGIQNITTDLTANGYPNIKVQKDVPLIWNLRADSSVLNSCNGTLIISEYGVREDLRNGDNIISFTPEGEGTIQYSCAMGMVTGQIKMVEDLEQLEK